MARIAKEAEAHKRHIIADRVNAWRRRLRGSMAATCRWIKGKNNAALQALRAPTGEVVAQVDDMFALMHDVWDRIYNIADYQPDAVPTCEGLLADFGQYVYRGPPFQVQRITGQDLHSYFAKRASYKAGGLDGWRTGKVILLPV